MRTLRNIGLVLLLVVSIGCQTINVNTDWDTTKDFSQYKSYAWLPHPPGDPQSRLHNSLVEARVREAVNTEMANKGYRYSSIEGADLLITYYLGLENKIDVNTIYTSYGYGYRGWYGGMAVPQTTVTEYEEGTLMVDILLPPKKDLLWRSTASTRLSRNSNPEKSQKTINAAVAKMFKKFPPPASK